MRKQMARIVILIVLLGSSLGSMTACGSQPQNRYQAEFLQLFDTVTVIVGYAETEEKFQDQVTAIHDNLEEYHQLYDIYNTYPGINNIKTINEHAGGEPVEVDQKIIDLLLYAKEAYELTDGELNVAMGSVLRIWHNHREAGVDDPENASLPTMDELEAAKLHTNMEDVVIDETNKTVFLRDKDMLLDVGAIAKGYAVERVAEEAMENGFTSGLISVGGNVRAIGYKGNQKDLWGIGIQNPDTQSETTNLFVVQLTDLSVVTSGDYERYYMVDGQRYHHIIDPDTLFPATYYAAVTIITHDSGLADALSTSIYNMPIEQGKALVESMPDTEALWVDHDGTEVFTSGFEAYIQ